MLEPLLSAHGLRLVSGWYSGGLLTKSVDEEYEALASHVELLCDLRSEVLIYCDTTGSVHGDPDVPLSRRPILSSEALKTYGESLTQLGARLLSRGIRLVYHHHAGTVIQTESEIDQLMQHTGDAVALLLDTGHLAYVGVDPQEVFARHAARIRHVHLKDVRPKVLQMPGFAELPFLSAVLQGVFTVPGDGSLPFDGLIDELIKKGYSGWLVVEADQDPAFAEPLVTAQKGYDTVRSLLQKALAT